MSQRDWSTSLKQARAPGTDVAELSKGSTGTTTHLATAIPHKLPSLIASPTALNLPCYTLPTQSLSASL